MAILVKMERGNASMNVPIGKLDAYLEAGWVEVGRYETAEDEKPAPVPVQAAAEEKAAEPAPAPKRAKKAGRSRRK